MRKDEIFESDAATRRFSNITKRVQHFREMIRRYKVGDCITEPQHIADLRALLIVLADRGAPSPDAVAFFAVTKAPAYGKPCFRATKFDGSSYVMSYTRNSVNKPGSDQLVNNAFRMLVANDKKAAIGEVARRVDRITCHHCGRTLTLGEVAMDHDPVTFLQLMDGFLKEKGYSRTQLTPRDDGGGLVGLEEVEIGREWRAYHQARARYVPSCGTCNRSKRD